MWELGSFDYEVPCLVEPGAEIQLICQFDALQSMYCDLLRLAIASRITPSQLRSERRALKAAKGTGKLPSAGN